VQSRVEALLNEIVRPLVEADGGHLELVSATEKEIVIRLTGACAGCPGAPYTRSKVIEPVLREIVPGAQLRIELKP
jgi:Fe-S cluster biogenesis protein NfuA